MKLTKEVQEQWQHYKELAKDGRFSCEFLSASPGEIAQTPNEVLESDQEMNDAVRLLQTDDEESQRAGLTRLQTVVMEVLHNTEYQNKFRGTYSHAIDSLTDVLDFNMYFFNHIGADLKKLISDQRPDLLTRYNQF